jgi:hypothetical protein
VTSVHGRVYLHLLLQYHERNRSLKNNKHTRNEHNAFYTYNIMIVDRVVSRSIFPNHPLNVPQRVNKCPRAHYFINTAHLPDN